MKLVGEHFHRALAALALLGALSGTALAQAQGQERVNVYQYAVDHPVADVPLPVTPSLGASVPQNVELATAGDDHIYGYFYYEGRPVLVEMQTRSVVRIDQ